MPSASSANFSFRSRTRPGGEPEISRAQRATPAICPHSSSCSSRGACKAGGRPWGEARGGAGGPPGSLPACLPTYLARVEAADPGAGGVALAPHLRGVVEEEAAPPAGQGRGGQRGGGPPGGAGGASAGGPTGGGRGGRRGPAGGTGVPAPREALCPCSEAPSAARPGEASHFRQEVTCAEAVSAPRRSRALLAARRRVPPRDAPRRPLLLLLRHGRRRGWRGRAQKAAGATRGSRGREPRGSGRAAEAAAAGGALRTEGLRLLGLQPKNHLEGPAEPPGSRAGGSRGQSGGPAIPPEMCFVFDPVFSTLEIEVLSGLGFTMLPWNEEGKRSIEGPTLFYMIHCGKALYNNLLWSNWSAEALSQMVVVGNSFRGFEERLLAKVFRENYSYIAKVLEATQEEALPPHTQHPDVFNDTSVHCFPLQKLRGLPQDCWACRPEPLYPEEAQLEIIRSKPQ
uniref:SRR1 domain containing n=1 Tax=Pseudonaja textilis TaxID=8673 RepID=A0A670ZYE7_PSETE